jgi:hypothetical protein
VQRKLDHFPQPFFVIYDKNSIHHNNLQSRESSRVRRSQHRLRDRPKAKAAQGRLSIPIPKNAVLAENGAFLLPEQAQRRGRADGESPNWGQTHLHMEKRPVQKTGPEGASGYLANV